MKSHSIRFLLSLSLLVASCIGASARTLSFDIKSQQDFDKAISVGKQSYFSNPHDTVTLTFYPGEYILSGEWHVACNVTLKGIPSRDKKYPKILIAEDVITNKMLNYRENDSPLPLSGLYSIIQFGKEESDSRINVSISNLEFGVQNNSKALCLFQRHLINVNNLNNFSINNCTIKAENGQITLIDIRQANNITISNNILINNTVATDNSVDDGGICFIRGGFDSCNITQNNIRFYGSDEMIAFQSDEGSSIFNADILSRRNLNFSNNNLIYGDSDSKHNPNQIKPVYHSCDKLITFISTQEKTADGRDVTNLWENIIFSNNNIILYDRVQYTIHISNMESISTLRNFKISSNNIVHKPTLDSESDPKFVCDISAGSYTEMPDYSSPNIEPISIENNNISCNDQFAKSNSYKYRFLEVAGVKVNVSDNNIIAKGVKQTDNSPCATVVSTNTFGGEIKFFNNNIIGFNLFSSFSMGGREIAPVSLDIDSNNIQGSVSSFCWNLSKFNLSITNNNITTSDVYFLGQRFGHTGSLIITDNNFNFKNLNKSYAFYYPAKEGNSYIIRNLKWNGNKIAGIKSNNVILNFPELK